MAWGVRKLISTLGRQPVVEASSISWEHESACFVARRGHRV